MFFAASNKIMVEGSTTVLPIAQLAAEEFMNQNSKIDISIRGGGSGVGIASLIDGSCDIADASRPMKDKELKTAAEKGVDPKANVVAMDGIAVIVNKSNPLSNITKSQLKDIFTGKISDWSEISSKKGKIVVISRDSASGTFETFITLALDKAKVRADALMQSSNQGVKSIVTKTPGAIGYVGIGYISPSVKDLKVNDVKCTKENVLNGKYAFSRPLFMYTNGKPKGATKEFLEFIASSQGQKLVEEAGYVGLK